MSPVLLFEGIVSFSEQAKKRKSKPSTNTENNLVVLFIKITPFLVIN